MAIVCQWRPMEDIRAQWGPMRANQYGSYLLTYLLQSYEQKEVLALQASRLIEY